MSATTLNEELREQARWKPKPDWERSGFFRSLLANEFLSAEQHAARNDQAVRNLLSYAGEHIPYYRRILEDRGLSSTDIDAVDKLSLLPILTKTDIQERHAELSPRILPAGHADGGHSKTSGTTGQPVRVKQTGLSWNMFACLKQRELRWFRFDPAGTLAALRPGIDMPRQPGGDLIELKSTCHLSGWLYVNRLFHTGPFVGFREVNAIEDQVAWLHRQQPDYLLGLAGNLEHLALAFQDQPSLRKLKGIESISQQLTDPMRRRIEGCFSVPVQQNYGLNEIGIVAARCPEGGRYHVHTEHCLIEIVNQAGKPCGPGEWGKLLVTGLSNAAMPLIRYDADDMAKAEEGPCPCGRTLPAFAEIAGRYGRQVLLPPGTRTQVNVIGLAIEFAPKDLMRTLRQYQMHQYLDRSLELRLVFAGPAPEALLAHIRAEWQKQSGPDTVPFAIKAVDEIPKPPNGKFQNFTSDFAPAPHVRPEH
jgi:phenylacetate-CoA ligase